MAFPNLQRVIALAVLTSWCVSPPPTHADSAQPGAVLQLRAAPELDELWSEGRRLEVEGQGLEQEDPHAAVTSYLGAARAFESITLERPGQITAYWRSARAYWKAGDTLPLESKEERLRWFARADAQSLQGIERDPDCAECMLWRFAAMGRLRTTRGVMTGIRQVPEMAELLDRGIALSPTHSDDTDNSTLGNLHYSSAIFYRILPDWFWIGWVVGVRGDKDRALAHSRTALSLHPTRLDYQIEVGCQLLCLGSSRKNPELLHQGSELLRVASQRAPESLDDQRELDAAQIMLEHPEKACGYSGDTWIEIDRRDARRATAD